MSIGPKDIHSVRIAELTRAYNDNIEKSNDPATQLEITKTYKSNVVALRNIQKILNDEMDGVYKGQSYIYVDKPEHKFEKIEPNIEPNVDSQNFFQRVGKVFSDAISALSNFFGFPGEKNFTTSKVDAFSKYDIELAVENSKESIKLHSQYKAGENEPASLLEVSENYFTEPMIKLNSPKAFIHKTTAESALELKTHLSVPDLTVKGFDVKLVPKSFENNQISDNKITPTSYILGNPDAVGHLANVYVFDVGVEKVVIRTGVIDTPEKIEDFINLISSIHDKYAESFKEATGKDLKLRVVSQQLNSFEDKKEAKMIQNQHRLLAQANKDERIKGKAEIIHINTPSNGWYHMTKWVDSLGMLGSFIKSIAPMNFLQGERLSKIQNMPALGTYVNWVVDDLSNMNLSNNDKDLLSKLGNNEFIRINLKNNIDGALSEINRLNSQKIDKSQPELTRMELIMLGWNKLNLKESRKQLKECLVEDYNTLISLENSLKGAISPLGTKLNSDEEVIFDDDSLYEKQNVDDEALQNFKQMKEAYQMVASMRHVLGSQLGIEGQTLDRGQEGMFFQMLNDKLGVVCAMNCKSGLDRTGIWHAIKLSMLQLVKKSEDGSTKAFSLVQSWDSTTNIMNRFSARFPETHLGEILDLDDSELREKLELPEGATDVELRRIIEEIKDVLDFRKDVLNNLITIGIPITVVSTGVMGLKWNTGHEENLIPLNFLPSHVSMDGVTVPLVIYNSAGDATGITKEGAELLTKYQKLRGS
ncbi:MAG TPA: hypothetical protein VGP47_04120 [Parachlamydiaceae bacterium]|nr:hypothetical protein [Parachlamydiaceae bacterium]